MDSIFSLRKGLRTWRALLATFIFCCVSITALCQTNSWTGAVSGNWEDPHWSLGIPPGTGQTVLITNAGFKAVGISPSTAQNDPQTLSIAAFTIASPANSFNTLLLNYAGVAHPLVIGDTNMMGSLIVNSNSAVTVLSSALQVRNTNQFGSFIGEFSIGGNFTEDVSSQVTAGFMNLGDIGPGVFVLTNNSALTAYTENIDTQGVFNQQGGTNTTAGLGLAGQYNMIGGFFGSEIDLRGGTFNQTGGAVSATLLYTEGFYVLAGGTLTSPYLNLPDPPGPVGVRTGSFLQTGGTNLTGSITDGELTSYSIGAGSYVLSNGVLYASGMVFIGPPGGFSQWGGLETNAGFNVAGMLDEFYNPEPSAAVLGGGTMLSSSILVNTGTFTQSGGTNLVAGTVTINSGAESICQLNGGMLGEQNATVSASAGGGFFQTGGVHVVTNTLAVNGQTTNFSGYTLSGGQLTAPNLQLTGGAAFHHTGGTLTQTGTLTLAGDLDEETSGQQFGQLQLSVLLQFTNSILSMPGKSNCVVRFADSSGLTWSNQATLTIENWSGSVSGGGNQRIVFGSSASALTAQQVSQIQFLNPGGLAPGTYPAQILSNGEITPGRALASSEAGHQLVLQWGGTWILQTATNATGPYSNVTAATSPYTNSFTGTRRFFRLRQ
jgi:hypothetical protein